LLIDEIEQGLESDRAKHLVRTLAKNHGQVFITTQSSNVLTELQADNIFLMKNKCSKLTSFDKSFQGCLRNNPDAFFTKKIIVCEGATEVGICRAINEYRISTGKFSNAVLGIGIVDGTGTNFIKYCEKFKEAGFEVCAFCDSDESNINIKKQELKSNCINVVDCDKDNAIEEQIFSDLPWKAIQELIKYVIDEKGETCIIDTLKNQNRTEISPDWNTQDSIETRIALGKASKLKNGWFKRIDHGEFLGNICCKNISDLKEKNLGKQLEELINWSDNA
jgi:putative ATP-dependent endonuclease of the OLD family